MAEDQDNGMGVDPAGEGALPMPGAPGDSELAQMLRDAHRAFNRALQGRISPFGVSMGQWFFLRALWERDGLTQRELSQRVGMMEPTTVTAINSMERRGLVERVRNPHDRRKVNIYLTQKGRSLRAVLDPFAAEVAAAAVERLEARDIDQTKAILRHIIDNLDAYHWQGDGADGEMDGSDP